MNQQFLVYCDIRIQDKQLNTLVLYGHFMHNFNMHVSNTYQWNRDGTIQGTGVPMHHAKSITGLGEAIYYWSGQVRTEFLQHHPFSLFQEPQLLVTS